jgi:hypothetical protein
LQVIEIPQNRQSILWKNLEKKALDLEILGKKICRLGHGPEPWQGRVPRPIDAAGND